MHANVPADRFAAGVEVLCRLIARHGHLRLLAGPLVVLIWARVRGIGARVEALLARMQAGRLRRYPARRAPRPSAAHRPPAGGPLPRGPAWLVALIPETAAGAAHLQLLLADPEVAALLTAAPQLRRTLRPLCRMLGVSLPRPASPPPAPLPEPDPPQPSGPDTSSPSVQPAATAKSSSWPGSTRPSPRPRMPQNEQVARGRTSADGRVIPGFNPGDGHGEKPTPDRTRSPATRPPSKTHRRRSWSAAKSSCRNCRTAARCPRRSSQWRTPRRCAAW
jgi:hypothetical protein